MLSRFANLLPRPLSRAAAAFGATRFGAALSVRGRIVLGCALAAGLAQCRAPSPPARTTAGVAEFLGSAVGGEVRPDDYVWEEHRGFLIDEFWGRSVLFLGKPMNQEGRDLYRARVRLTRGGRAISVLGIRNLTNTPLDDDGDLTAHGNAVAISMRNSHGFLGVRLCDLSGEGSARRAQTWGERLRASIESFLESGSPRGIGVTEIAFDEPPSAMRFELADDMLVLALGDEAEPASLDLHTLTLNAGPKNPFGAKALDVPHRVRILPRFVGEIARPLFGRALASSVEETWLRASDVRESARKLPPLSPWSVEAVEAGAESWPPPSITAPAHVRGGADGKWRPATEPRAAGTLPLAYETAVASRDDAIVRLVALDTRQIDLGFAPGYEEPIPSAGPHGSGRFPGGDVVAIFGGATPSQLDISSGRGATVLGRIMTKPLSGLAGIAIDDTGSVHASASEFAFSPEKIPFFRQTNDALIGGKETHRPSPCDDCKIERSALAINQSRMLVYAWSKRATAADLGDALAGAGCDLALPLATRPANAGFAIVASKPSGGAEKLLRIIDPAMSFSPPSEDAPAAEEFFFATIRDLRPHAILPAGASWTADTTTLARPLWLPAIHEASVVNLGAEVHLAAFAPGRFTFRLRSGGKEIVSSKGGATLPTALEDADLQKAAVVIGLGTGRRKGPRGLAIGGAVGLPMRGDAGLLVCDTEHGTIAIALSTEQNTLSPASDVTELPLTADAGKLLPLARELGSMRSRTAACVSADGTTILASTTFDSDEATTGALLDLGCSRVVALDRGTHIPSFMQRASSASPIESHYEATTLYAISKEMTGRAIIH